jgi:hypothetical protein
MWNDDDWWFEVPGRKCDFEQSGNAISKKTDLAAFLNPADNTPQPSGSS